MSRSVGPALHRTFVIPDEVPVWQRSLTGVCIVVAMVMTSTVTPDRTPTWVHGLLGGLGALILFAVAAALFRRFHPALRRVDRTGDR